MEFDEGMVVEAPGDMARRAFGQSRHLQRQVVLIRPEPRHGTYGLIMTEDIAGDEVALVLSVAPGLEPHAAAAIDGKREGAAVTCSVDTVSRCSQAVIDGDAVFHGQSRGLG